MGELRVGVTDCERVGLWGRRMVDVMVVPLAEWMVVETA